jgi:hypothetical protein
MLGRAIAVGVAVLVGAVPVRAQQRGTVEFLRFGSHTAVESNLPITNGQFGVFVGPEGTYEVKDGGSGAAGALELGSVNTGVVLAPSSALPGPRLSPEVQGFGPTIAGSNAPRGYVLEDNTVVVVPVVTVLLVAIIVLLLV